MARRLIASTCRRICFTSAAGRQPIGSAIAIGKPVRSDRFERCRPPEFEATIEGENRLSQKDVTVRLGYAIWITPGLNIFTACRCAVPPQIHAPKRTPVSEGEYLGDVSALNVAHRSSAGGAYAPAPPRHHPQANPSVSETFRRDRHHGIASSPRRARQCHDEAGVTPSVPWFTRAAARSATASPSPAVARITSSTVAGCYRYARHRHGADRRGITSSRHHQPSRLTSVASVTDNRTVPVSTSLTCREDHHLRPIWDTACNETTEPSPSPTPR